MLYPHPASLNPLESDVTNMYYSNQTTIRNMVMNCKIWGIILDKETNMLHDVDLSGPSADLFEIHKSEP